MPKKAFGSASWPLRTPPTGPVQQVWMAAGGVRVDCQMRMKADLKGQCQMAVVKYSTPPVRFGYHLRSRDSYLPQRVDEERIRTAHQHVEASPRCWLDFATHCSAV